MDNPIAPPRPQRLARASADELEALSELCLDSKAHWGYDSRFMAACEAELALTAEDLSDHVAVIRDGTAFAGVVQASVNGTAAVLEKLFIAPEVIGHGLGRLLFQWAAADVRAAGARRLEIASDPGAVPFYEAMGAEVTGSTPSESIPGRRLPRLTYRLD